MTEEEEEDQMKSLRFIKGGRRSPRDGGGDIEKQREVKAWNWKMREIRRRIERAWKRRKVAFKILCNNGLRERGQVLTDQKRN